ncbi:hypothetical protein [Jiangella sp. DSM 45060]|uniref:hypothetical protein n=1 Tax=Jiangella sp. DSM 45060 TaxID=1798224 RepID=UPI00087AB9D9|nr:hypothetical protein [Jiangella sp. DSM 45060]SDS38323.1 hypothetical protein SAMN04515669_0973 [Jiangella sp. DSM 45060]
MLATQRLTMVVAVVLLAAACSDGGGGGASAPSSPATTEPAITAPPTLTPEKQAEADIQATFEELIAAWDDFKANASDYGGTSGWNVDLVGSWRVQDAADADLANWIAAWRASEIEQVGRTSVATHSVPGVDLDVTAQGVHQATSVACLDMSRLGYVNYDGSAAELSVPPSEYQVWRMTWVHAPAADPESGTEIAGWHLERIDVSLDEPCS